MNLVEFWSGAHARQDGRWLTGSKAETVLARLGVDISEAKSVLEVGPGFCALAGYLRGLGKKVVLHDIVMLDDPCFAAVLPLDEPVDVAIAHLVMQHVPDHAAMMRNVLDSLVSGGAFYFDVVTAEYSGHHEMAKEFDDGVSFPFTEWHLVDEKSEIAPGWFACISRKK